jgi:transposase
MDINDILRIPQFLATNLSCTNEIVTIYGELQNTDKTCPSCGKEAEKPHQYYEKEVRHLSFCNLPTYLCFQRKDFICECGKVFLERLDFQDLYSKYTTAYEDYLYELAKNQDIKRVAELENLSWCITEGILKKKASLKSAQLSQEGIKLSTVLHVDEIAVKKGHSDFVTVIYTEEEILETMCGKKSVDLEAVLNGIVGIDKILYVCMDFCAPFASAVRLALSNAVIIIDRFHITKLLNKTLDKLRCQTDRKLKAERIDNEKALKKAEKEEEQLEQELGNILKQENSEERRLKEQELRQNKETLHLKKLEIKRNYDEATLKAKRFSNMHFLLGKDYEELHRDTRRLVNEYLRFNTEMKEVYWLCQDFRKILYAKKPLIEKEVSIQLTDWCTKARKHLGGFVKTLEEWWSEVLNACIYPFSNGRAEGFNNKIKLVKRIGFGFRNLFNFKLRIQAACNP